MIIKDADEQDKGALLDNKGDILREDVDGEFKEDMKRPGYWNLENCIESAKLFRTRSEWQDEEKGAYAAANRNGWLDICLPPSADRKPRGYWTLDRCIESASEFDTRKAWQGCQSSAYHAALKNGWLDICLPLREDVKPFGYWTFERCIESAKRFKTRNEWDKREPRAYNAACRKGWLNDCCAHMDEVKKPNGYWTFERCMESAMKFMTRDEWSKGEGGAYGAAYKNYWFKKCCAHMDGIRTQKEKEKEEAYWTYNRCLVSASEFNTQAEWKEAAPAAYKNSRKYGWLTMCCWHMKKRRKPGKVDSPTGNQP